VAIRDAAVVAAWPGFVDEAYGVAIDVGSTTLAGHACTLLGGEIVASAGRMNPQIRFGEDLMSRVSYVMMNPGGAEQLTSAVRAALDELIGELLERAGVPRDRVLDVVIVGNPIMHHLVLGIDPTPLGGAPFTLATSDPVRGRAGDLGLDLPGASYYVAPCIAGHVGADTAAAVLAEQPHRGERMRLVVDVGTNAEIVLAVDGKLLAASSPTGPAFEGAQISAGQRAAPGAIERVRIDRTTLEPRFRVIGVDAWSDDPSFAELAAETGVTGICGSGIVEVTAELFLAGVIAADGTIDGSMAARTPRVVPDGRTFSYVLHDGDRRIAITQNDVRAIQLAKAALYAGVRLLMDHAGVETVDAVRLAGAFGSQIDLLHAMVLGLVPDCDLAQAGPAGNAAGTGALIALLSAEQRREIERVAREVTKIETAVEPRFQAHFVDAMALPHKTAPSTHLSQVVQLPDRAVATPAAGRRENPRRRAQAARTGPEQEAAVAAVEEDR